MITLARSKHLKQCWMRALAHCESPLRSALARWTYFAMRSLSRTVFRTTMKTISKSFFAIVDGSNSCVSGTLPNVSLLISPKHATVWSWNRFVRSVQNADSLISIWSRIQRLTAQNEIDQTIHSNKTSAVPISYNKKTINVGQHIFGVSSKGQPTTSHGCCHKNYWLWQ